MSWKPKFYIVFPRTMYKQLQFPEEFRFYARVDLPVMLQRMIGVKTIGSELKLIWKDSDLKDTIDRFSVTYDEIEAYCKADSDMLSFSENGTREKAIEVLKKYGATELHPVDSYRDVILYQAYFYNMKEFPSDESKGCKGKVLTSITYPEVTYNRIQVVMTNEDYEKSQDMTTDELGPFIWDRLSDSQKLHTNGPDWIAAYLEGTDKIISKIG